MLVATIIIIAGFLLFTLCLTFIARLVDPSHLFINDWLAVTWTTIMIALIFIIPIGTLILVAYYM